MKAGVGRTAMAEKNNADETTENESRAPSINRRRFVRSLGAVGGLTALGSVNSVRGAITSNGQDESEVRTEDITGRDEQELTAHALDEPDVQLIHEELAEFGYTPKQDQANAFHVYHLDSDLEYRVVIIPYQTGSNNEQSYILWTDSSLAITVGARTERFRNDNGMGYETTSYTPGTNWAKTTRRTITPEELERYERYLEDDGITIQNFPTCNINFECVATAAAKAGILVGACASCASLFIPACFACAGSGILFVNTDCSLCK